MSSFKMRYIDLFCGIGGFRIAIENVASKLGVKAECVFSSDVDEPCRDGAKHNRHSPQFRRSKCCLRDPFSNIVTHFFRYSIINFTQKSSRILCFCAVAHY